jgi:excisionase family DNA binding protein
VRSLSLPRLLTVNDVADILQLSPRTVWRMVHDERLPVVRIGRAVRIRPEGLTALIEGKTL